MGGHLAIFHRFDEHLEDMTSVLIASIDNLDIVYCILLE